MKKLLAAIVSGVFALTAAPAISADKKADKPAEKKAAEKKAEKKK